jgi:hypothetical protein
LFATVKPYSPVSKQDFIWLAEYADGTQLFEFDMETGKENLFYDIQKEKLIRFGLIGHGMKLYYEVLGGVFKLHGRMIEVVYRTKEKDIYLTGQKILYNDIIQFKNAYTTFNPYNAKAGQDSKISQFNFGYKQNLVIDGIKFGLRFLCHVPFGKPIYLSFRVVADSDLDGALMIRRNNIVIQEINAPLRTDVGGEFNWILK